ncbi:hypothetical protein [Bacteroides sp.]|uniref:hypothetical protein n=1 Tax=Bacteroides sp. TaxID=29523 RepID=UPI003D0E5A79
MKEENYNRACEIKKEIEYLKEHLKQLEKARFTETNNGLTFRFNDNHIEVWLTGKYIPNNFNLNYVKSVEFAIEKLESEFDKL